MNKKRFEIGNWVHAKATMVTDYDNDFASYDEDINKKRMKVIVKKPANIIGQIVGLKRFQLGEYRAGGASYGYGCGGEPDFEQAWLLVIEVITVWEIKQGMLNRAVYALDEDVDSNVVISLKTKLPVFYSRQPVWTERDKQNMREEMANMPRDKKGRWVQSFGLAQPNLSSS